MSKSTAMHLYHAFEYLNSLKSTAQLGHDILI